jgi:hypothetical protein
MPTWFLLPDFTFLPTQIPLGTVLSHPLRPTKILAVFPVEAPANQGAEAVAGPDGEVHTQQEEDVDTGPNTGTEPQDKAEAKPKVDFPGVTTITEPNHKHSNDNKSSFAIELWAKVVELVSAALNWGSGSHKKVDYGAADHEVQSFSAPFSDDCLAAIINQDKVSKHINSGRFGKRPVYLVSGLRITNESFTVTKDSGSTNTGAVSGSGPVGTAPAEAGGKLSGSVDTGRKDSYNTAPGIVFAYRLHVIRVARDGDPDAEIFSHTTGFLTGTSGSKERLEMVEASPDNVQEDLEEEYSAKKYQVGNDFIVVPEIETKETTASK